MSLSTFDAELDIPKLRPLSQAVAEGPARPSAENGSTLDAQEEQQTAAADGWQAGAGWSWCPRWQRYIHCETKVRVHPVPVRVCFCRDRMRVLLPREMDGKSLQTMWDPARQVYSRWDEAGNVVDFPAEASSAHGGSDRGGEKEGYVLSIDCHSTSASSDDDVEARFIAYYDSHGQRERGAADYRAERERSEPSGADEHGGVTICGDWIFDGEFWNTADGVSYHPGLQQYFSKGERIYLKDDEKPAPDGQRLQEEWQLKRYQMDYGTWAGEWREGEAPSVAAHGAMPPADHRPGRTHVLGDGSTIGRSKSCSLHIARSALSRIHAKIRWRPDLASFTLLNCSERNRTYHNGKPVSDKGVSLAPGDIIFLGKTSCLSVTQVSLGGAGLTAAISLHHAERGPAFKAEALGTRRSCPATRRKPGADCAPFDGEPLSGDEAAEAGGEAALGVAPPGHGRQRGLQEEGEGEGSKPYRDRAAERRDLHAESDAQQRQAEYRGRQLQLARSEQRAAKARRREAMEATLQAIDASCFRAPGSLPQLRYAQRARY